MPEEHPLQTAIEDLAGKNSQIIDDELGSEMKGLWDSLSHAELTIAKCRSASLKIDDSRCYDSLQILYNCVADLSSAVLQIIKGEWRSPGLLLRGAFEDISCVAAFLTENENYVKYKNGRLSSQDCVKLAKGNYPELSRWYGITTQLFTHLNYASLTRLSGEVDGKLCRALLVPLERKKIEKPLLLITLASVAARFCGSLAELASLQGIDEFYYYKREGEDLRERRDTEIDVQLRSVLDRFEASLAALQKTGITIEPTKISRL